MRRVVFILAVFCLASLRVSAQEPVATENPMENISASGLLQEAQRLLNNNSYIEAIPFLEEYIDRMQDNKDRRVRGMIQDVRLKLGKIHLYMEDSLSARTFFKAYLDHKPIYKWREVNKFLALSQYNLGDFEACISAVTNGLSVPPKVDIEEEKIDYSAVDKDDLGGMTARQLKRFEKLEEEGRETALERGLSEELTSDVVEEPEYSQEELTQLHMLLAESYSELLMWERCLKPYRYVIEHETHEDIKGYAIMKLVSALIEQGEFDEVSELILELYRTDARYNIRVNLALMSAATALFGAEKFDSALPLYRMVLPRQDLFEHQKQKINRIRIDAGMQPVEITITTNVSGRVQTLFGDKSTFSAVYQEGSALSATVKPITLIEAEERLVSLLEVPPYETEVMLRLGQLYAACSRPWEAVLALDDVYAKNPDGDQGKQALYDIIRVLIDPLEDYEQAEKRGWACLEKETTGILPRQIAYLLTGMYQKQEKWAEIKSLHPKILAFSPEDNSTIEKYEVELWYMQAIADLMMLNYAEAEKGFGDVLNLYAGSHQHDNALYWFSMSQLFQQKYKEALSNFEAYVGAFPQGSWVPDATFRAGICLFATEQNPEAKVRFTKVIDTWPDSSVYSDACSLRGDLLAADGLLDEAQRDYEEAIAKAQNQKQDTYAVFQMVSMFELEKRYEEILAAVHVYMDRQGEDADVAKAAYWVGKTKFDQGLVAEALEAYTDAVMQYGGVVRQDGVDLIINEVVMVSRRLEQDQIAALKDRLNEGLAASDNETVKLRIQVLLARLEGAEAKLGRKLLAELKDLTQAPPPALALICDASFEQEDYSRSEEILTLFLNHFEDSEEMRSAYKLRAFDLYSSGNFEAAAKLVGDAQALYGTEPGLAWAQLMRGRLELAQGQPETARKTFRAIFGVRTWRGPAYAEAAYALGELNEAVGDLEQAFSWYQRTYTLYKGYAQGYWAAEAYLASARVLKAMGLTDDIRNTYRAMLYDNFVNSLPQADEAARALAPEEVAEIKAWLDNGVQTNLTVTVEDTDPLEKEEKISK